MARSCPRRLYLPRRTNTLVELKQLKAKIEGSDMNHNVLLLTVNSKDTQQQTVGDQKWWKFRALEVYNAFKFAWRSRFRATVFLDSS